MWFKQFFFSPQIKEFRLWSQDRKQRGLSLPLPANYAKLKTHWSQVFLSGVGGGYERRGAGRDPVPQLRTSQAIASCAPATGPSPPRPRPARVPRPCLCQRQRQALRGERTRLHTAPLGWAGPSEANVRVGSDNQKPRWARPGRGDTSEPFSRAAPLPRNTPSLQTHTVHQTPQRRKR